MADFSMWGAERAGSRILEKDQQAQALNNLALQKGAMDIQMDQARMPLLQAQVQKAQAEVKHLDAQDRALAEWQARRTNQRGKPATDENGKVLDPTAELMLELQDVAEYSMATGKPGEARQAYDAMSRVARRQVQADENRANIAEKNFKLKMAAADKALGYLRGVQNQAELTLAGDAFEMDYGFRPPVFSMPYSPENVKAALQTGLTERQAAQTAHEAEMDRLRGKEVGVRERQASAQEERNRLQAERDRVAAAKEKKTTGNLPNLRQTNAAKALIAQQFPDMDFKDVDALAETLASEARARVQKNPGMTWDGAQREALKELEEKGLVQPAQEGNWYKAWKDKKKPTYNPRGAPADGAPAPAKPTAAPVLPPVTSKGDKIDTTKLKPNQPYLYKGMTVYWTGTEFTDQPPQ